MNGAGRGTLPPGDPHHFQLSRRYAFSNADVIVIVGTPFDFRMGYGKRLSPDATVVQIDLDYRTVGKNRDIDLGIVGDAGLVLKSVAEAASGRLNGGASKRKEWLEELRAAEQTAHREAAAATEVGRLADPPVPAGQRDQRLPHRGLDLHRRRRRHRHLLRAGRAAQVARPLDGPGAARHARRRCPLRARRQEGTARQGSRRPLRRRRVLPHRLGLRDPRPLQPPVRRDRRQQLLDEPDPLRPGRRSTAWSASGSATPSATSTTTSSPRCWAVTARRSATPPTSRPALQRARESGKPSLINVWVDPDAYAPGTMNQTMYK